MNICPNCGSSKTGKYCADCGQHLTDKYSVVQWAREFASEQLSLTARLPQTLSTLFIRPGKLSAEWSAGRRARYIDPVRLFLLALLVALTVSTLLGARSSISYQGQTPELIDLDPKIRDQARLSVIFASLILVPLMALLVKIALLPRKTWYVDHLVFSIHFASMTLFIVALMWPVERMYATAGFALGIGWILTYLILAMQRAYGLKSMADTLRAFVVLIGMGVAARGVIVATLRGPSLQLERLQYVSFENDRLYRRALHNDSIFLMAFAGFDSDSIPVASSVLERAADEHLELVPDVRSTQRDAQTALLLVMIGDSSHGFRHCREKLRIQPTEPLLLATCFRIARAVGDAEAAAQYAHRLLGSRYREASMHTPSDRAILPGAVRSAQTIVAGPPR